MVFSRPFIALVLSLAFSAKAWTCVRQIVDQYGQHLAMTMGDRIVSIKLANGETVYTNGSSSFISFERAKDRKRIPARILEIRQGPLGFEVVAGQPIPGGGVYRVQVLNAEELASARLSESALKTATEVFESKTRYTVRLPNNTPLEIGEDIYFPDIVTGEKKRATLVDYAQEGGGIMMSFKDGRPIYLTIKQDGVDLPVVLTQDQVAQVIRVPTSELENMGMSSKKKRRYPPGNSSDTIVGDPYGNVVLSNGFHVKFIQDKEILEVHPIIKLENKDGVRYGVDNRGRAVVHQPGARSCTAAVTAMLILDMGAKASCRALDSRNLGQLETKLMDIREAGLKPVTTQVADVEGLDAQIRKLGPAIVSVGGEVGGHVMVVDSVDLVNKTARIREPFHGWSITITLDALKKRIHLGNEPIIQATR